MLETLDLFFRIKETSSENVEVLVRSKIKKIRIYFLVITGFSFKEWVIKKMNYELFYLSGDFFIQEALDVFLRMLETIAANLEL